MKRLLFLLVAAMMLIPSFALASEQVLPNGIARIGGNSTGALDYSSVNVAVVDTGIDLKNPDLNVVGGVDCTPPQESLIPGMAFGDTAFRVEAYDSEDLAPIPNATGYEDGYGHGTHVAGIIAARDNGIGVVGVAPNASLWSVRVLDSSGSGTLDSITCGLDWIHENRDIIDVVNMSLGGDVGIDVMSSILPCGVPSSVPFTYPDPAYWPSEVRIDDPMHAAICRLHDDGIPVIVAAGNGDGLSEQTVPAAYDEVITVSSFVDTDGLPGGLGGRVDTDVCPFGGWDDKFFTHHNFTPEPRYGSYSGKAVDISAPGVCVLSTLPGGFYASLTGTSMATPHVTGIVARIYGDEPADKLLGVEDVREILLDNAEQTTRETFRDKDAYLDPIAHVIGE